MISSEQLIKLFSAYWGRTYTLEPGKVRGHVGGDEWAENVDIFGAKLDLRPLSTITDEEAIVLVSIIADRPLTDKIVTVSRGDTKITISWKNTLRRLCKVSISLVSHCFGGDYYDTRAVHDGHTYLQSIGIDLPVFIAPNHEDNGKTLKELGYAVYM